MNSSKLTRNLAAILVLVLFSVVAYAQPGSGGFGDDPQDVPVDAGLSFLIGAGIAYGAKKLYSKKNA
jgi:hypothetical protein